MVDGAAFAHRTSQSKGPAASSSRLARSTANRLVPVGDSVPNSAGSNRRAPGCPNSDSVPHTPTTIGFPQGLPPEDRKSTRLNSSHGYISYAVFCLKKKKKKLRYNCDNRDQTISLFL